MKVQIETFKWCFNLSESCVYINITVECDVLLRCVHFINSETNMVIWVDLVYAKKQVSGLPISLNLNQISTRICLDFLGDSNYSAQLSLVEL